ncbi:MAG: rRNA pseudouridine synthase [Acidaminococcaceae bacterium]|nr:rRNA pseudouridine synthase [Acidaminococcaceae bacterium]
MERLQKIIAAAGIASRREAEKIILAGRVKVNSKVVNELGVKADPSRDKIIVDGKPLMAKTKSYYMFYKPRGVVTTMKDPEGRKCISDFVKGLGERVYPVGRLDYNTEGLLLLTNDGELAQKLTHPSYEIRKTYRVKVLGIVPFAKLDKLRMGVELEDGLTAPATVDLIGYDRERGMTEFNITIHEGRNRQVRRMCDVIGFPVRDLQRTKMGPLALRGLGRGKIRELDDDEVQLLMKI